MRNWMMAILDVVGLVKATRAGIGGMDRAAALVIAVLAFFGTIVSGGYTWVADWLPTWRFANGESPAGYGYTPDVVADALIVSAAQLAIVAEGMAAITLGTFIGAVMTVGITLFPTVIQFIAPRVLHPAARVASDIAIWFDFITDFPQAWAQSEGATTNPIGRLAITIVLVFLYSLLLQTVFVLCLTAFWTAVWVLVRGEPRGAMAGQTVMGR